MYMDKKLIGYVISSEARRKVLRFLLDKGPSRPVQIAEKLPYDQPYVTRSLQGLEKKRLVECLTPKKKAWRVYAISDLGRDLLSKL